MTRANRTFASLVLVSLGLILVIGWSTHRLLMAGAPGVVAGGTWPELQCLLIPGDQDRVIHLLSYLFLATISASTASALATLWRQHRQTRRLLRHCLAAQPVPEGTVRRLGRALGLEGRVDVVDSAARFAFCYGFRRPRILLSTGLLATLSDGEIESLLLHEREHARQRDPLKVAVGRLLVAMMFFMPLASSLYHRYLVEKELAADQAAIAVQGQSRNLARALLTLIETTAPRPSAGASAAEALEARIAALAGEPPTPRTRLRPSRLVGSLVIAALALLPVVSPLAHAAPSPSLDHDVVHGCHALPPVPEPAPGGQHQVGR
jgi:Zn-dependent protease with chaperone function